MSQYDDAQLIRKLSNTDAELKKSVAYKKSVYNYITKQELQAYSYRNIGRILSTTIRVLTSE